MNNVKSIVVVLAVMLMLTGIAMAGNISFGMTDALTGTTLSGATVTITSPVSTDRLMGNVDLYYTATPATTGLKYVVDSGTPSDLTPSPVSLGKLSDGTHTISIIDTDGTTVIASTSYTSDNTAPAEVTGLHATSATTSTITWSWVNPTDTDFNNVRITVTKTIGGSPVTGFTDLPVTGTSLEVTGLLPATSYTILVQTEDNAATQVVPV